MGRQCSVVILMRIIRLLRNDFVIYRLICMELAFGI